MASSNLKLIIQKGPRNGETLEFNSRSTIRIGRLVKGNNLPIKDSGISSKHLEIKFNSDSLKWLIKDLDSSNGTIVNSSQLKPFEQFEIKTGDEVKIGELTSIRVEIGEEIPGRRNPRRQVVSKSVNDLKCKVENDEIREEIDNRKNPRRQVASKSVSNVEEELKLGENDEIREEIGIRKNPRRQVLSKSVNDLKGKIGEELKLGENVEIRDEIDNVKNPKRGAAELGENVEVNNRGNTKKQAASKKGHELGSKGELPEESCSNLADESSSMVGESKEENVVKGVEGNRRGRVRGRTKQVRYNVGVGEDKGNVKLKPEGGVSTRRTRNTRRGEVELLSLDDVLPARRTRSAKNVEDVMASSLMEKVVESKGSGTDDCNEAKNIGVVEKEKTRGGRGRKKKVAESLENIQAVTEEKIDHEVWEKECSEKVVDSREQPCDEPANDAPEKILHDDAKNEQFMEVAVPELEQDALSVKEKHCAELMGAFHHVSGESLENVCSSVSVEKLNHECLENEICEKSAYVIEQPCDEPVDDPPEQSVCPEPVMYLPEESVCDEPVNDLTEQRVCNEAVNNPSEQSVVDETKIEQLMPVEVPEQEKGALSMSEKPCAELIYETNLRNNCVSLPVGEQRCTELMDETIQQNECVSPPVKEKDCVELMVEPTQHDDCDAGPSHVEEGVCDGLGSDAVVDGGRTEELEVKEIDKESETNCYDENKGPETTDKPDLEKMTLGDWFTFLETHLPKQIRATRDEILEEMQKRSAQFDEYVQQYQKEKNELPLAMESDMGISKTNDQ